MFPLLLLEQTPFIALGFSSALLLVKLLLSELAGSVRIFSKLLFGSPGEEHLIILFTQTVLIPCNLDSILLSVCIEDVADKAIPGSVGLLLFGHLILM